MSMITFTHTRMNVQHAIMNSRSHGHIITYFSQDVKSQVHNPDVAPIRGIPLAVGPKTLSVSYGYSSLIVPIGKYSLR